MADANGSLTQAGPAQILRDHLNGIAAGFPELRGSIADLRGEIGIAAGVDRDTAQIAARRDDNIARRDRERVEHRRYIAQIFSRMEQHDTRFEAISRDIRRILDSMS